MPPSTAKGRCFRFAASLPQFVSSGFAFARAHKRWAITVLLVGSTLFTALATAQGQRLSFVSFIPNGVFYPNPAGASQTYSTNPRGIDLANPFFQNLGTNGRTCATCHAPSDGMSVSSASVELRFLLSQGRDPIFRPVDGSNCNHDVDLSTFRARQAAYSLLRTRGLMHSELGRLLGQKLTDTQNTGRVSQPRPAHMRNLIFAINITLDGCCDHTKQSVDEEKLAYFTRLTREADLQVFGRKTYQLMVPYWPEVLKNQSETKADTEFARAFVSINKIVFSRSLDRVEDTNTRIVRANPRDEILKLKQEQGKSILVGGVDIASQLIQAGLVDEYRFVVGPIIAGPGRRLLEGVSLPEKLQLKLVESKTFTSGSVALRYLRH